MVKAKTDKGQCMTWLETINLRIARVNKVAEAIELCGRFQAFASVEKLLKVRVYRSSRYSTDISIHLTWGHDPGVESALGRSISEALGELGLINHTVWKEQEVF